MARAVVVVTLLFCLWVASWAPQPNPSTDGRYHTCGYVTDAGVTEHLDAYLARCHTNQGEK